MQGLREGTEVPTTGLEREADRVVQEARCGIGMT